MASRFNAFKLFWLLFTLQEVDEEDEQAFEAFMSKDTPARRTLADVIMEKIRDKKTEIESQMSGMSLKDFIPQFDIFFISSSIKRVT